MIGQKISPILEELEDALWEHEAYTSTPPEYTDEGFRAAVKIFMSAILDKMWALQTKENMPLKDKGNMAEKAGKDFRDYIKMYTNIDTHEFYKK